MGGAKVVVLTFSALGEAAQATQLAQRVHAFTPTGQDFVRVSLMAYIPDHPVMRGVEYIVQGHGELNGSQV